MRGDQFRYAVVDLVVEWLVGVGEGYGEVCVAEELVVFGRIGVIFCEFRE